jgi:hypothetical protein
MLITGMPEHDFFIYSVAAEEKDRGHFKYKFPSNLQGIQEEFLDEILALKSYGMEENVLNAEECRVLYD